MGARCGRPGPAGCRPGAEVLGARGALGPWAASLSPLRVSTERRPQEAAPREAAADRRAQRQASKRAGPARTPSRWGGGAGDFDPKKCGLSAARSGSQRSPCAILQVTRPLPLSWKERTGFSEAEGDRAVAESPELHSKGGEQPGVHFERVDMFWERGHSSPLGAPTARRLEGRGRGDGHGGLDTKLLGSDFWVSWHIVCSGAVLRAPLPSLLQHHFLFLEPDASSRGTKETCPRDPPVLPQLWSAGVKGRWGPRRSPRPGLGGPAAHPLPAPPEGKVVHCDLVALSSALGVSAPRTDAAAAGARPAARPRPLAPPSRPRAPLPPAPLLPSPHTRSRPFPRGAENFERRSQWRFRDSEAGGRGRGRGRRRPSRGPLLPPPPPPTPRPAPARRAPWHPIAVPSERRPPSAPNLDSARAARLSSGSAADQAPISFPLQAGAARSDAPSPEEFSPGERGGGSG